MLALIRRGEFDESRSDGLRCVKESAFHNEFNILLIVLDSTITISLFFFQAVNQIWSDL